ncbi:hypothetical protein, partial [Trebonia sp.]|uniref:hypothetical protein n=1 Tax=Trebonia sp. TaxID=2767075 RepID=UPI002639B20A
DLRSDFLKDLARTARESYYGQLPTALPAASAVETLIAPLVEPTHSAALEGQCCRRDYRSELAALGHADRPHPHVRATGQETPIGAEYRNPRATTDQDRPRCVTNADCVTARCRRIGVDGETTI